MRERTLQRLYVMHGWNRSMRERASKRLYVMHQMESFYEGTYTATLVFYAWMAAGSINGM